MTPNTVPSPTSLDPPPRPPAQGTVWTSADGLSWQRYEANPVIELTEENGWLWMSGVKVGDRYHIYFAIGAGSDGIGVITGTIAEVS